MPDSNGVGSSGGFSGEPFAPHTTQVFGGVPSLPFAPSTDQVLGVLDLGAMPLIPHQDASQGFSGGNFPAELFAPDTPQVFGVGDVPSMPSGLQFLPDSNGVGSSGGVPGEPFAPHTAQVVGGVPSLPFAPSTDQVLGVGDLGAMPLIPHQDASQGFSGCNFPAEPFAPDTPQVLGVGDVPTMPSGLQCQPGTSQVFQSDDVGSNFSFALGTLFGDIGSLPATPVAACALGHASVNAPFAEPSHPLPSQCAVPKLEPYSCQSYLQDSQIMHIETMPPAAMQPEELQQFGPMQPSQQPSQILAHQKSHDFKTIVRPSGDDDLPCKVASVKLDDGHVVAAHVKEESFGNGKCNVAVEWEWVRAVGAVGMKTKKRGSVSLKKPRTSQQRAHGSSHPTNNDNV